MRRALNLRAMYSAARLHLVAPATVTGALRELIDEAPTSPAPLNPELPPKLEDVITSKPSIFQDEAVPLIVHRPARKLVEKIAAQEAVNPYGWGQGEPHDLTMSAGKKFGATGGMLFFIDDDRKRFTVPGCGPVAARIEDQVQATPTCFDLHDKQTILFIKPYFVRRRDATTGPPYKQESCQPHCPPVTEHDVERRTAGVLTGSLRRTTCYVNTHEISPQQVLIPSLR